MLQLKFEYRSGIFSKIYNHKIVQLLTLVYNLSFSECAFENRRDTLSEDDCTTVG